MEKQGDGDEKEGERDGEKATDRGTIGRETQTDRESDSVLYQQQNQIREQRGFAVISVAGRYDKTR